VTIGGTQSRDEDVKAAYSPASGGSSNDGGSIGGSGSGGGEGIAATPTNNSVNALSTPSEPTRWLSSIERYDPVISRWHEADFSLPLPLGGFALLRFDHWLIIAGGFTTFTPSGLSSKCWAIDLDKLADNIWLPLPDLPSPIADMAHVVID
jgi:hypothetical protein